MNFLRRFFSMFTTITTGILALSAVLFGGDGYTFSGGGIFLKILASGAATALVTAALYPYEPCTRKIFWLRVVSHFVMLCAVMTVFGIWFGWIEPSVTAVIGMCGCVTAVYVFTFVMQYIAEKKEVDDLNRRLEEKRRK